MELGHKNLACFITVERKCSNSNAIRWSNTYREIAKRMLQNNSNGNNSCFLIKKQTACIHCTGIVIESYKIFLPNKFFRKISFSIAYSNIVRGLFLKLYNGGRRHYFSFVLLLLKVLKRCRFCYLIKFFVLV